MKLTENEDMVLNEMVLSDMRSVHTIERKSEREYDLTLKGNQRHQPRGSQFAWSGWMPLCVISNFWGVYQDDLAEMSSYPSMVLDGDWSGIRDSSEEQVWEMFEFILERETVVA